MLQVFFRGVCNYPSCCVPLHDLLSTVSILADQICAVFCRVASCNQALAREALWRFAALFALAQSWPENPVLSAERLLALCLPRGVRRVSHSRALSPLPQPCRAVRSFTQRSTLAVSYVAALVNRYHSSLKPTLPCRYLSTANFPVCRQRCLADTRRICGSRRPNHSASAAFSVGELRIKSRAAAKLCGLTVASKRVKHV